MPLTDAQIAMRAVPIWYRGILAVAAILMAIGSFCLGYGIGGGVCH